MTPSQRLDAKFERVVELLDASRDARTTRRLLKELDKLLEKFWDVNPE